MPHMILRHSNNLSDCNFKSFFKNLHNLLNESLGVKVSSCSSMVISHDQYLVGDGDSSNAFVHLDIKVKPIYNNENLDLLGTGVLEMLKKYIANNSNLKVKISVDCFEVTQHFKS